MNNQKGDRREMVDLENMHVRDLIVYYLKTEKKDHTAHSDEIIDYVRNSQPEHVKNGSRSGLEICTYSRRVGHSCKSRNYSSVGFWTCDRRLPFRARGAARTPTAGRMIRYRGAKRKRVWLATGYGSAKALQG
ncbi:MAG: hypothetical protein ACNYVW_10150 [Methanosarcinales archaeon]